MKAGIIAAGLGERLRAAGVDVPKPLVEVGGRTLLARAIEGVAEAGAERIAIIVNAEYPELERAVRDGTWPRPIDLVVKTTPSSMESVFALEAHLRDAPFLLATVDALLPAGALARLAAAGRRNGPSGTLAVTTHVDDEKPLRVAVDEAGRITAMGEAAAASAWITSGVYFFHPTLFDHVEEARRRRLTAFRALLGMVVEAGGWLFAEPVGKSLDVDRLEDVAAAERYLAEVGER